MRHWIPAAVLAAVLALGLGCRVERQAEAAAAGAPAGWETSLDRALARAKREGKPVFVDFHAAWCGACRKLDSETLASDAVRGALEGFVPVKLDTDKHEKAVEEYGVQYLPTLMVLDASGKALSKVEGFVEPGEMVRWLERGKGAAQT